MTGASRGIGKVIAASLLAEGASPRVLEDRAAQSASSIEEVEAQTGAAYAIGRMVTAAEVATVVAWLASPERCHRWRTIPCGGGIRGTIFL